MSDKMREEFETWARGHGLETTRAPEKSNLAGIYLKPRTELAWCSWCSWCAALATQGVWGDPIRGPWSAEYPNPQNIPKGDKNA